MDSLSAVIKADGHFYMGSGQISPTNQEFNYTNPNAMQNYPKTKPKLQNTFVSLMQCDIQQVVLG